MSGKRAPGDLADPPLRSGAAVGDAPGQATARLAAALVEVRGDGPLAPALAAELGTRIAVTRGAGPYPAGGATLVVLATSAPGEDADTVADCWLGGIPLLRVSVQAGVAHLGPYVDPRYTPCLACATGRPDDAVGGQFDADDVACTAELAAEEILSLVSRAADHPPPVRWRVVGLDTRAEVRRTATTRPGCPTCNVDPGQPTSSGSRGSLVHSRSEPS